MTRLMKECMKKVDKLDECMDVILDAMYKADDARDTNTIDALQIGLDALIEERNKYMDMVGVSRGYEDWNDYCWSAYDVQMELAAEGTHRRGFRY